MILNSIGSKNVVILDPQTVLSNEDYCPDGLHLNKRGKSKMCDLFKRGFQFPSDSNAYKSRRMNHAQFQRLSESSPSVPDSFLWVGSPEFGRDGVSPGGDGVSLWGDGVSPGRDGVSPGRDGVSPGRDGVSPGRDGVSPGGDGVSPGRDGVSPGRDGVSPGWDGVSSGRDGVSPGRDGVSPGRDGVSPGGDGVSPGRDGVSPGGGGVSPGGGGVSPGGDGVSPLPLLLTSPHSTLSLPLPQLSSPIDSRKTANETLKADFSEFPKCFKAVHFNAQSLRPHLHEIRSIIDEVELHAILISESWLKPALASSIVDIPGYTLLRNDRVSRRGGGVAMYLRDDLSHKIVSCSSPSPTHCLEYLAVEINLRSIKVLAVVVYRPPEANDLSVLDDFLAHHITLYQHLIVMSDMNVNVLNTTSHLTCRLNEILSTYNVSILPSGPTHHSLHTATSTQIDLTLTVQTERVKLYKQHSAPGISRHDMLCLAYSIKVPKYPVKYVRYRDLGRLNEDTLSEYLDSVDWNPLMSDGDSVDQAVEIFTELLLGVFDQVSPVVEKRVTRPPVPWMTPAIKSSMAVRDKLWTKYKRTRLPQDRVAFTAQKNATNYLVRRAQRRFSFSILRGSSKSTWRKLNYLGIGNLKSSPPVTFTLDELNDYFTSVVPNPCPRLKREVLLELRNNVSRPDIPPDVSFSFEEVSERTVSSAILSIKSKARGCDEVDIIMLKMSLPHILPVITRVFNDSLSSGVFPSGWRSAEVIPLNKVVSPSSCGDFRPVAILPVLSKALEKVAVSQIQQYMETFNLLDPFQSGFRRQHSTTTALVKVTDDIRLALNARKLTILALLDMSKAFDSVDFDVLLEMLRRLKFTTSALSWIDSYLRGRRQRVKQQNQFSEWKNINSGVPQGSVAGPLLFAIYISGIQRVFQHCKYHIYADDIQIYIHCLPGDLADAIDMMNEDLNRFHEWASKLLLTPNPSKSKALVIASQRFRTANIPSLSVPPILLNGAVIPIVNVAKNLGVMVDDTLSWKEHVKHVRKKVFYCLYTLGKFRGIFPMELKRKLVECLVFPHFDYCDQVYGGLSGELAQSLQVAQNACVRYVCNLRRYDHVSDFYTQLKWLSLEKRRNVHDLTLLFKILTTQMPHYLHEVFQYLSDLGHYPTRSQNTRALEIPLHRTLAYSNSFHIRAARLWNNLPVDIRNTLSTDGFKVLVKEFFS
ncbi:hypothetical protein M8J77_016864 [Diaphorina citri]|nr:hypothetical protein M8J77_016864 [Diaphorina citri]